MKKLICSLVITLSVLSSQAATWVLHATQDNATCAAAYGPLFTGNNNGQNWMAYEWWTGANWDWGYDQSNPLDIQSGTVTGVWNSSTVLMEVSYSFGWTETMVLTSVFDDTTYAEAGVFGPYPDYLGSGEYVPLPLYGGEYWIDFASDGTARISTTAPTDFGKWAWDGSINPSWVEPLAVKGKKGHRK